jgi:hypothetical protein
MPPEVDFLILADSAQVQGNKLYMLGGGWDNVHARRLPAMHPMGIGVGILVPWTETNRKHRFRLQIRDEDHAAELLKVEGEFEQGRPAGTPVGSTQRVILALNVTLKLEQRGQCVVELWINEVSGKSVPFGVVLATAS